MAAVFSLAVPAIIASVAVFALFRKVDVFKALKEGRVEGLLSYTRSSPRSWRCLRVNMLRAAGALDALSALCRPLFDLVGIPSETTPLVFIRPVSGSGALAVGSELIREYGPDSLIGRTAAVMLGSTETTFYVIAVYFGAAGIRKTRYAIRPPYARSNGFAMASLAIRLLF
jgi:spore maturation protein B